jgi:hypothetical protein
MELSRENLMIIFSEEKENFSKYSQLCALYQISPDPIAMAKHLGKIEILQMLLQERPNIKK